MTKKATRLCSKLVDVELSKRRFVCSVEIAIKLRRDSTDMFIVLLSKIPMEQEEKLAIRCWPSRIL